MQLMMYLKKVVPLRAVLGIALLVSPLVVNGQSSGADMAKYGEVVFAKNCSFCHGDSGAGRNAPRLAGRGLEGEHIEKVIAFGVKDTAMAAWGQILTPEEYLSVVSYVKSLNGISATVNTGAPPVLSAEAAQGRELFRDPTRGLGACSNCHAIGGRGVNIAPAMSNIPSEAAALRNVATPQVKTVTVNGESFPALATTPSRDELKVYDLTTVPPVSRTFATSAVKVADGSTWQHASVVGKAYSDQELSLVLAYLKAAAKP